MPKVRKSALAVPKPALKERHRRALAARDALREASDDVDARDMIKTISREIKALERDIAHQS